MIFQRSTRIFQVLYKSSKYFLSSKCGTPKLESRERLLSHVEKHVEEDTNKVTVVGLGEVGIACVTSILFQGVTNSMCLIDSDENKLIGELLDLQHGSQYIDNTKLTASTDYSASAGSRICIITAGVRQKVGESRLNLVQRNVDVMKTIVPQLVKYSPKAILMMVSNPVDVLSYVAWKLSGLPKHRVVGAGTSLDSARFRFLLAQKIGLPPTSCHGWIIGEHGDSSVAAWSGVNFAGVRLQNINPCAGTENDTENWIDIHKQVVDSAYQIIKRKGYTNWAIGLAVSAITHSILGNTGTLHAVSVNVQGIHDITKDVYLSLPAAVNASGIKDVVRQTLSKSELKAFRKSVDILAEIQAGIVF